MRSGIAPFSFISLFVFVGIAGSHPGTPGVMNASRTPGLDGIHRGGRAGWCKPDFAL